MQPDERTTLLNDRPENGDGRYVLYWMQIFKRASHNHALNFAARMANERKLPLVVYEGLKYYYPWANDRLHTFILEGVAEKRAEFERRGVRYVFYLQRNERDPRDTVVRLANDAALVVTDDFPCFIIPKHNLRISERARVPVYAVDSNGIIPLSAFDKEEFAARTIRPKVKRLLPQYLESPADVRVAHKAPDLEINCPEETHVTAASNIAELVAGCAIDHTVVPSPLYHGGTKNGRARLRHFVQSILPRYDDSRNEPGEDGTSRLSPYLHFGFLSAHEVVAAVNAAEAPAAAKEAYLEELIVRRELSYNFTRFNPHYDSLDSLPAWAQRTMSEHATDPRPAVLPPEQIERGETYDELWDATQRELLRTGEIHNYARMLWGKKVIEWRASYEDAFRLLEHLNNKYALDGRNPNSYAGILWCFGKHDRAWGPERPVFGKLRYMTSQSMARKIVAKKYIEWTKSFPEVPLPPLRKERAAADELGTLKSPSD
ncbi:MAG TPA: deoxyribodipyrimidine photo-lyase [Pyrinomonadaceae bacterium]|nr:deoxyribodipyrimidine photo-lyase [Pyrinomonadaceae bacterium]